MYKAIECRLNAIKEQINDYIVFDIKNIINESSMGDIEKTDLIHRLTVFEKIMQETIKNIIENTRKEIKTND